jgi:hypothetical protein
MLPRIGVMQALNRNVERVFTSRSLGKAQAGAGSMNQHAVRKSRCGYLRLKLPSGIPMQVVVPSVSLAALLQGTAPTVFVETPSSPTLFKPVSDPEISGPPTSGTVPAVSGIAGGGAAAVGGDPLPIVPVVCCANAAQDRSASGAATERLSIPIGASLTRKSRARR